jgi:hypothetical protein
LKKEKRENKRKLAQKAESSESDELPPKQLFTEEKKQQSRKLGAPPGTKIAYQ